MTSVNQTAGTPGIKFNKIALSASKKGHEVRYVLSLNEKERDQNIFRAHTSIMKGFRRREIVALKNKRNGRVVFGPIFGAGGDYKLRSPKAICTSYDHRYDLDVQDGDELVIRKTTVVERFKLNWKSSGHAYPAYVMGALALIWSIATTIYGG